MPGAKRQRDWLEWFVVYGYDERTGGSGERTVIISSSG